MKQEDKQFLTELAHELNTQDNCATRNPVWCILDKHYVYIQEGYGDEYRVYASDEAESYTLEDFADYALNTFYREEETYPDSHIKEEIVKCTLTYDLQDVLKKYFLINTELYSIYEVSLEWYIPNDATGFLTKKSAEEHLKANAHHYSPYARAYALSAWRNPVYERLINIIKETKWEEEK